MLYELAGINKTLTVNDTGIHIENGPYKEDRYIPFRSVLSVAVKKPGIGLAFGYIYFQTAGATDDPIGGGNPDKNAFVVTFKKQEQYDMALQIKNDMERVLSGGGTV